MNHISTVADATAQWIYCKVQSELPRRIAGLSPEYAKKASDEVLYTEFMLSLFRDACNNLDRTQKEKAALRITFAELMEALRDEGIETVRSNRPGRPD